MKREWEAKGGSLPGGLAGGGGKIRVIPSTISSAGPTGMPQSLTRSSLDCLGKRRPSIFWRRSFSASSSSSERSCFAHSFTSSTVRGGSVDALRWPGERQRSNFEHQTSASWLEGHRERLLSVFRLSLILVKASLGQPSTGR